MQDGVVLILRQFAFPAGHFDPVGHGPKGQDGLVVCNLILFGRFRFLRAVRVQDIAEDHRLAAKELEVGVHELTEGEGFPVLGVSQLFYCLGPAGTQHRSVYLGRDRRRMNRGQPHHIRDTRRGHHGCADLRGLFVDVYAVFVCHFFIPPCTRLRYMVRFSWKGVIVWRKFIVLISLMK